MRRKGRPKAPAAGSSTTSLARYAPRQDLFLYLEYQGLDAHADAWQKSAAYKLLNDTKLGSLLEDLAIQGIEMYQSSLPPEKRVTAAEVIESVKYIAQHGFLLAGWGKDVKNPMGVIVIRDGDRPEIRRWWEAFAKTYASRNGLDDVQAVQKAGRRLQPLDARGACWWFEGRDLVIAQNADAVLATVDGKQETAAAIRCARLS